MREKGLVNHNKTSNRVEWLLEHPVKLTGKELSDERTRYILKNLS